ncbi:uncharacterized protein [Gossypium hirsutum]|uniref:Uncharacterized protein n=1 Tax=Gossypium hirsutum TaxID=3635 RepID=A0ABM3A264_GOSHI|nr:uncharacterized protein LOC107907319 [Gossypium hirsutum]
MTFVNPKSSANWSPCNTAVASAITTDQTSLASTLIFTHPYGGGIHFTMDRGLGCFKVNVLPRYSIPKPLVKVIGSSIGLEACRRYITLSIGSINIFECFDFGYNGMYRYFV